MGKKMVLTVVMLLLGWSMTYAYEYYGSSTPQPITDEMVAKARAYGVSVIGNGPAPKGVPSNFHVSAAGMVCAEKGGYTASVPAIAIPATEFVYGKTVAVAPQLSDPMPYEKAHSQGQPAQFVSSMVGGGSNPVEEKQGFGGF